MSSLKGHGWANKRRTNLELDEQRHRLLCLQVRRNCNVLLTGARRGIVSEGSIPLQYATLMNMTDVEHDRIEGRSCLKLYGNSSEESEGEGEGEVPGSSSESASSQRRQEFLWDPPHTCQSSLRSLSSLPGSDNRRDHFSIFPTKLQRWVVFTAKEKASAHPRSHTLAPYPPGSNPLPKPWSTTSASSPEKVPHHRRLVLC